MFSATSITANNFQNTTATVGSTKTLSTKEISSPTPAEKYAKKRGGHFAHTYAQCHATQENALLVRMTEVLSIAIVGKTKDG